MRTETIAIDTLTPYARNAKKHPQEQVDKLAAWITKIGFTQPVVIDSKNEIVIGHGRLMAAKQAGLTEVPCVRVDGLTEAEVKALRLFDNKVAETGWDSDLLQAELVDLSQQDFDLSLTGFSNFSVEEITPLEQMPTLASGDRAPIQQMTFTLHDTQVESIKRAIDAAKAMGDFGETGNENSNGNALARVAELFLMRSGNDGNG